MSIILLVYLASVVHSITVVIALYAIFSIILIGIVKFAKIIHADETRKLKTLLSILRSGLIVL